MSADAGRRSSRPQRRVDRDRHGRGGRPPPLRRHDRAPARATWSPRSPAPAGAAIVHPPTLRDAAEAIRTRSPTPAPTPIGRGPGRGGRQDARGARLLLGRLRADRAGSGRRGDRARRGRGHRPGRVRRGHLDARRAGSIQVPTTLLGMVDAAVGGKTGINTDDRQEHGRRLPRAVGGVRRPGHPGVVAARTNSSPGWPRWSRPASSPTRRSCELVEEDPDGAVDPTSDRAGRTGPAGDRGQGRGGARPTCASRTCGRSSTTATPSAMRSRSASGTAGGTAPPSRSVWCSPPSWPGRRAGWTTTPPIGTSRCWPRSACRPPTTRTRSANWSTIMGSDKKTSVGHAAVRGAGRAGPARPAGRAGPGAAGRGLLGGRRKAGCGRAW